MSTTSRPRGRHPARVYWVRRTAVLVTALALVFAIGRLLGGSGGAPASPDDTAGAVSARPTASATTLPPEHGPYGPVGVTTSAPSGRPTGVAPQQPLAQPDGPCDVNEIIVTPTIATATAGAPVRIGMELTGIKAACTFEVSSKSVAVRITKGTKRIWTSQQCQASITTRSLVVRNAVPIPIVVRWSGRYSDDECSRSAGWAMPGNYTVTAAAIGSEPSDKRFALMSPPRPIVTRTITPKPTATATPKTPVKTPTG